MPPYSPLRYGWNCGLLVDASLANLASKIGQRNYNAVALTKVPMDAKSGSVMNPRCHKNGFKILAKALTTPPAASTVASGNRRIIRSTVINHRRDIVGICGDPPSGPLVINCSTPATDRKA